MTALDVIEGQIRYQEGEVWIILPHDQTPPPIYDKSEKHPTLMDYSNYSVWFKTYTQIPNVQTNNGQ